MLNEGLLMGKVVVFNGPPSSGKDSLAEYLRGATLVQAMEFKRHLIEIALMLSGVARDDWEWWYQSDKEKPRPELSGHSCRSFLIMVSEDMVKPNMGRDYFGRAAVRYLKENEVGLDSCGFCFTDSGFAEELQCVVAHVGAENVIVIQLHRQGTSFEGDSRDYLDRNAFPDVMFLQHQNDQPIEESAAALLSVLKAVVADNRANA